MSRAFVGFNALLVSFAAFSLQACGGGGSIAISGSLWHKSLATDGEKRSTLSTIGSSPTQYVDINASAVPNVSGTQYAVFDYNSSSSGRTTVVTIKDAATSNVVYTASFNGYVRDLRMSPTDAPVLLVNWGSSAGAMDAELVIVDMASKKILQTLSLSAGAAANWLPDGRYVHIDTAGKITMGKPVGTRVDSGNLNVAGRKVRTITANPQGTKLLSNLVMTQGDTIKKDL
jgi:hypothetical protein